MKHRPLGRTGQTISMIGLGCVTFGREIDQDMSFRIMDYAVEQGISWLDTAEGYGGGNAREYRRTALGVNDIREVSGEVGSSEHIIGRWLQARGCRDRITVCTKVSGGNNSPENIDRALSTSLERLQTDYVDIYELHTPDDAVPIQETLSTLAPHVYAGRVRTIGCSNISAAQLREALDVSDARDYPRFEVVQPPYSLASPEAETALFPLCRQEQIAVTTFSPLAAGFLAGKYLSDRSKFPLGSRFDIIPGHADIYFNDRNFRIVDRLREKAQQLDLPMVRLAMAWAMSSPDVTSVIVGARTTDHIDNAMKACEMRLDPALRAEMSAWTREG